MINNLGLFITHHIFLTEDQFRELIEEKTTSTLAHCVPTWVDAKTGKNSEPSQEIFCKYKLINSKEKNNEINVIKNKEFEIYVPQSDWKPPENIDFEAISSWKSEERMKFLKERDKWWFNNPKLPDSRDLENGYLRFEIKIKSLKIFDKDYSVQHIIEISRINKLLESFC